MPTEEDAPSELVPGVPILRLEDLRYTDDIPAAHRRRVRNWARADGAHANDLLRWSSKPVLIESLLDRYDSVLYFDNDIYVVDRYDFLFDDLGSSGALLTPHWRCLLPHDGCEIYAANFWGGLYNAGFVGFSRRGLEPLAWWRAACRHYVGRRTHYYDDQRYLDVLPTYFDQVKVLRHRGLNVASWNRHLNVRSVRGGRVYINDVYPLVFIHFSCFNAPADPDLRSYLHEYERSLGECREYLAAANQRAWKTSSTSRARTE
ncbi:MAG: hypothetical protein ACREMB_03700 [Candidatus Rokuibacteriota bacterium]